MKRKILVAIYIILILIVVKLFYNIAVNSILINKYNKGQYSERQAKVLTLTTFAQNYVANYNYGNILYQNGEYEKAIAEYQKALKGIIPKDKECKIRINYALATCKTVQVNESDQDSINTAIEKYETSIDILTEKGCANKNNDNGHNPEAVRLKKDIQKEIDRLKKLQLKNESTNQKNEEKDDKTEKESEKIETEIQEIKENATKEEREKEEMYYNYNKKSNRTKKNW